MDNWTSDIMAVYRAKHEASKRTVKSKYFIQGFISSGTYGRVYKAQSLGDHSKLYAIKKFKPDKEGDVPTYTGISQSAIREMALNREINHENVVALKEVILEDKSIHMVFEYAEHDFLQLIHHHSQTLRSSIPLPTLKSLTYQLLNGLLYLHTCHILHRDLKPANILITSNGIVKIGDLGLARLVYEPLQSLHTGDKVVVTIWYRAPELLMGSKHYNKAIDCWAIGCVLAELASLRPIFKGEEAKVEGKKTTGSLPFQRDQVLKILEVLGTPDESDWPNLIYMSEYQNMKRLDPYPNRLHEWCQSRLRSPLAYDLLRLLFVYNPDNRLTAKEALRHKWFSEDPKPTRNAFFGVPHSQLPPQRRITQDDAPSMMPHPTQNTSHQGGHNVMAGAGAQPPFGPSQSQSKPSSAASFASLGGSVPYGAGQGTSGHARKKARLG
ncbi:CMGC/CDK/CDK8 protein kinase [Amanita rubescens]|nr:CMGC/CDK/CDK8 protein kinase [Amanita rubescens]